MNDHPYSDAAFADEVIARLNLLCEDPAIRADLGKLIESRVPCSKATLDHPSIQAHNKIVVVEGTPFRTGIDDGTPPGVSSVGFLGFLNGLVGAIPDGNLKGWGYIMAVFDDAKNLQRFRRSDAKGPAGG